MKGNRLRLLAVAISLVGLVGVLFLLAFVFEGTDLQTEPARWVDLSENEEHTLGASGLNNVAKPTLRVAIAPVISPSKSLGLYRGLVEYISSELNREPVFIQRNTYEEVSTLIRFKRCDVALVCSLPFVTGENSFGLRPLVVPRINDSVVYYSYIIVPTDSPASSLLDMQGLEFGSADILSCTGWLYPATWLIEKGEDPDSFFSNHLITGSHDRSITAVLSGYADGAAVDSLVYDQMVAEEETIAQRVKIIGKSPKFGMPPFVVHPDIDAELQQELLDVFLTIHLSAEGQELLAALGIDRFELPIDEDYDIIRKSATTMGLLK